MSAPHSRAKRKSATLILEDGTRLPGVSFGAEKSVSGEFVFHTGMVGYAESITDPSYCGQVLVFSYPLIGNYGVPSDTTDSQGISLFFESNKTHVSAIVVSEECALPSHWNSSRTLSQWLKEKGVPAVSGVDTRALIKIIREKGSLSGKIVIEGDDETRVSLQDISKRNLVAEVSTREIRTLKPEKPSGKKVVVVDCGIKTNQLRCLLKRGLELKIVPWDYDFTNEEWDGVFISNGPGDPSHCTVTVEHIKRAMEKSKYVSLLPSLPRDSLFFPSLPSSLLSLQANYGSVHGESTYGIGSRRHYL
jgi:carbamoyl-phosphate synthase small subunit